MNKFIYHEWVKLESARQEIEQIVMPVSEKDFQAATANKWSIAQILMHVVTSEKLARLYMTKKSQGIPTLRNAGMLQSAKLALLKVSQRLPVKYKAPKAIQAKTPEPLEKSDLIDMWNQERADLRHFLESIPEEHSEKLIFKHPIVGMFNAAQGVAFLREHLLHHKPQIVRLTLRSKAIS